MWYRIWSDGWIEQGRSEKSEIVQNNTVTFLKPFTTINYTLLGAGSVIISIARQSLTAKTTTSFTVGSDVRTWGTYGWYACGY